MARQPKPLKTSHTVSDDPEADSSLDDHSFGPTQREWAEAQRATEKVFGGRKNRHAESGIAEVDPDPARKSKGCPPRLL